MNTSGSLLVFADIILHVLFKVFNFVSSLLNVFFRKPTQFFMKWNLLVPAFGYAEFSSSISKFCQQAIIS